MHNNAAISDFGFFGQAETVNSVLETRCSSNSDARFARACDEYLHGLHFLVERCGCYTKRHWGSASGRYSSAQHMAENAEAPPR